MYARELLDAVTLSHGSSSATTNADFNRTAKFRFQWARSWQRFATSPHTTVMSLNSFKKQKLKTYLFGQQRTSSSVDVTFL